MQVGLASDVIGWSVWRQGGQAGSQVTCGSRLAILSAAVAYCVCRDNLRVAEAAERAISKQANEQTATLRLEISQVGSGHLWDVPLGRRQIAGKLSGTARCLLICFLAA